MPENTPNFPAVVEKGTAIAILKKEVGLKDATKILAMMLSKFCASFNVSKNMNGEQMADYAMTLIEESLTGSYESPAYRLEDFALFFEMAKTGKYGKPFDYVDGALINVWLDAYHAERAEKYRVHLSKSHELNLTPEEEAKCVSPERMKELFEPIIEQLKNMDKPIVYSEAELQEQEERRQRMNQARKAHWEGTDLALINSEGGNNKV